MENSAEALKFSFAIFVFVVALTTAFITLSQAKSTADSVFYYTDKTNFQTLYTTGNNIVGTDTVIATLFRYYKESLSITIKDKNGKIVAVFDTAIEKNCPWRVSNTETIARIKEFITGENVSAKSDFYNSFDYTDENNFQNGILKTTTYGATQSLKALCDGDLNNAKFTETFVETVSDGIYYTPEHYGLQDDGSTIQITPGTKKVYITFKLNP